jgi:hypothetical protein
MEVHVSANRLLWLIDASHPWLTWAILNQFVFFWTARGLAEAFGKCAWTGLGPY